jgi:iron complex outermembrane receptor protein
MKSAATRKIICSSVVLFNTLLAIGQHSLGFTVRHAIDKSPLVGASATMLPSKISVVSDSAGFVHYSNLPAGSYSMLISFVGMTPKTIAVNIPVPGNSIADVLLEEEEHETDEVIVTSTRISRSIADIATRVETISGEELAEKGNMKPGDIRMLLNESTGIQTQQTSATSYNSSIRIQGLDGRYTQVLRDGFPFYAGFAGGLSLMQVAPLDLKQIEVIKGSTSTLYGGGAIAGLVNLVSKTPGEKRELNFLLNATSAAGADLSGFYSERYKSTGLTLFASRNTGRAYDPAGIGLTAIPQFERYTVSPRLFVYGTRTTMDIGFSYVTEKRLGGDVNYIRHGGSGYFEKNNTDRASVNGQLTHRLSEHTQLNVKCSFSNYNRTIEAPGYAFKGLQQSGFSEASFHAYGTRAEWVAGVNLVTDNFRETKLSNTPLRDYSNVTTGIFIQHTWTATPHISLESGLRLDYTAPYGAALLPRISALFKISPSISARLGGGLGYKTPSVFNEAAEQLQFQHVLPIDESRRSNERSAGINADLNYRTSIGAMKIAINQLFFYTRLNRPLVLTAAGSEYQFVNANGSLDTKGLETNLRFALDDLKLFVGYTYADVNTHFGTKSWLPLTARHRLNNVLVYEQEGKFKAGIEAYYFSPQQLNNGSIGRDYWLFGLMSEKTWKHFSLFINFENLGDTRQSKFGPIYSGTITNPVFADIYAPLDGFIVNGGVKLRL